MTKDKKQIKDLKSKIKAYEKYCNDRTEDMNNVIREYNSYRGAVQDLSEKRLSQEFVFNWNGLFSVLFDLIITLIIMFTLPMAWIDGHYFLVALDVIFLLFIAIKRI